MDQAVEQTGPAGHSLEEGRRFVRRMYLPRTLGLALGAVCIGGGLWQQDAPAWLWALLLVNTLGWPHLAYPLALRSRDPYHAELRNLAADSAFGGAWIAAIGFNLMPSAVLVAMLAMDKATVGGLRFLARCFAGQVAAAAAVTVAAGVELQPIESGFVAELAALPLLIAYPVTVGYTYYKLARRVRQQNELLVTLNTTDGLTRLLNHTHWEAAVAREFQRCRRIGRSSAVLMIDIDHFKAINDTHGHQAGDAVIRAIADVLRLTLRLQDLPGRYGGEEFGAVLPDSDVAGARAIAERIRKRAESTVLEPQRGLRATVSIGFAALEKDDKSPEAWIARADRALYAAKGAGRNRSMDYAEAVA